ncbi:MAG TPA: MarR family winged helix-turn-helix transcriptional regulator [Micropepsaceae bacterium]|nr:MarR family winged helix-turn-helix transcriptional regulator [Micropepsaceae bacterium]
MALAAHTETAEAVDTPLAIKPGYLEALSLIERLHRQLLDVIKDELERRGELEVNSVQALMLFNIGDQELTAGELRTRGHYLGSNVSYNLKKLVELGYIHHERSDADRRAVCIRLADKGQVIRRLVASLFDRQLTSLSPVGNLTPDDFQTMNRSLRRLERFWLDQVRYRL